MAAGSNGLRRRRGSQAKQRRAPGGRKDGDEGPPPPERDGSNPVAETLQWSLRKRRFFFLSGILLGAGVMLASRHPDGRLGLGEGAYLSDYASMLEVPQSLQVVRDQLANILPSPPSILSESAPSPGVKLAAEGLVAKHPVVMIPGITSTGLEIWDGESCARSYFRQRIWGTLSMVQQFLLDTKCWLRHMQLDPVTGLDPDGVKVRASQGFEAADFIIGGYWVWAKVIENLARIGHDPNSMYMASYDWRLSFPNMERRDGYFSRLKASIEQMVRQRGERCVVATHSMGTNVFYYFMQWVSHEHDADWVREHVAALYDIAGPMLGLPKALASMYSGETQEFRELGTLGLAMQQYVNQTARQQIFRTFGSVAGMLPRGGDRVWRADAGVRASETAAGRDDFREMLQFTDGETAGMGVEEAIAAVLRDQARRGGALWLSAQYGKTYSHGIAATPKEMQRVRARPTSWGNMLESQLPFAPKMRVYCAYGVNRATERAYHFLDRGDGRKMINVSLSDGAVSGGIAYGDGDGSVPLISLGSACAFFWKKRTWNPSGMSTTLREVVDDPSSVQDVFRGGPHSGEHVDIMGNHQIIEDIVRVSAGDFRLPEKVGSRIRDIAARLEAALYG